MQTGTNNILILEQSQVMQKVLSLLLKSLPRLTYDMAGSLGEATAQIIKHSQKARYYQLVLTCLNCSGFSDDPDTANTGGLQLVALLRKDPRAERLAQRMAGIPGIYKRTPIIMMTSNISNDLQAKALGDGKPEFGVNAFLLKSEYLTAATQTRFLSVIQTYLSPTPTTPGSQTMAPTSVKEVPVGGI